MSKNRYFPATHRHAAHEDAILAGLNRTADAISPDCSDIPPSERYGMLQDCYVEMYGGMDPEPLAAWHELCRAKPGSADVRLCKKIAKAVEL